MIDDVLVTTPFHSIDTAPAPGEGAARVLIVSYRLPITLRDEGGKATVVRSSGGLASGLSATHARANCWWLGVLGDVAALDFDARENVLERLRAMRASAIELDPAEHKIF